MAARGPIAGGDGQHGDSAPQRGKTTIGTLLRFEQVTAAYGRREVLSGLSFDVVDGEVLGLVGPNGGGKTTILRLMLGLMTPRAGKIVRLRPEVRHGYVPQRDAIDPIWPLATEDVVAMAFPPERPRRKSAERRALARRALEAVGEAELASVPFSRLSGGQQQRALIARALVAEPEVLVLDEPTRGLDLASASGLLGLVEQLHDRQGATVVLASHDLNTVANHVDRVGLVLDRGFSIGPTEEMLTEQRLSAAYGVPVTVTEVSGHRVVFGASRG